MSTCLFCVSTCGHVCVLVCPYEACLYACKFVWASLFVPVRRVCMPVSLFICPSVSLFVCLFVCVSTCLSLFVPMRRVCVPVTLFMCLLAGMCVSLFVPVSLF